MATDSTRTLLLHLLDTAYNRPAWHGPNLKGSISRVPCELALWRPTPERKCIAEITLHAAYWKYTVWRRLSGAKRGSFPLKGSNWFPLADPFDERAWRQVRKLLDEQHAQLREAVTALPTTRWNRKPGGSRHTYRELVVGSASHDLYHAGQIRTLRALGG